MIPQPSTKLHTGIRLLPRNEGYLQRAVCIYLRIPSPGNSTAFSLLSDFSDSQRFIKFLSGHPSDIVPDNFRLSCPSWQPISRIGWNKGRTHSTETAAPWHALAALETLVADFIRPSTHRFGDRAQRFCCPFSSSSKLISGSISQKVLKPREKGRHKSQLAKSKTPGIRFFPQFAGVCGFLREFCGNLRDFCGAFSSFFRTQGVRSFHRSDVESN